MDKLISRISHEMGNAVTIVRCSLNILKTKYPQVSDTKYFDTVLGEIGYMEDLIKDISAYNSSSDYEMKCHDIYEITKNVVTSMNEIYEQDRIVISVEKSVLNETYILNCDSTKIIQVLINLLKNSAEAIGCNGKIDIKIRKDSDFIIISVSDDGCGIKENEIEHIFEPMVTYKINGTGMGLAIVKDIIEKHNGKIKVVSEENSGTTFEITLPC